MIVMRLFYISNLVIYVGEYAPDRADNSIGNVIL
jgi:hypothetical protein